MCGSNLPGSHHRFPSKKEKPPKPIGWKVLLSKYDNQVYESNEQSCPLFRSKACHHIPSLGVISWVAKCLGVGSYGLLL